MTTLTRLSPLDLLLSRMEGVKQYGKGWRCECPIGHKSKGTLAISIADDGSVLMHCFAGCPTLDVLHQIGMELSDLYEKPVKADMSRAQRRERQQSARQAQWAAALGVLALEALIVAVAGDQVAQAEPLNDSDRERLGQALERISGARLVLRA